MSPNQRREVLDILSGVMSGDATAERVARLNEIVVADREALRFMVRSAWLMQSLGDLAIEDRACDAAQRAGSQQLLMDLAMLAPQRPSLAANPSRTPLTAIGHRRAGDAGRSRWASPLVWMQHAAMVGAGAVAALVAVQWVGQPTPGTPGAPAHEDSNKVEVRLAALYTGGTGCLWGSGSPRSMPIGGGMSRGDTIDLVEGIAKFQCINGVHVRLEGPASFAIGNGDNPQLISGSATFVVTPHLYEESSIELPNVAIRADEGEFGCQADLGRDEVHCFEGAVELTLRDGKRVRLTAGESLLAESAAGPSVSFRVGKAAKSRFATMMPPASRLPINRAYVESVVAGRPFAYWRFSEPDDKRRPQGASEAPPWTRNFVGPGYSLRVGGDARTIGDESNRCLDLGSSGHAGHLFCDEPLAPLATDSYSIECWMRPSHFQYSTLFALIRDPGHIPEKHGVLFELGNHGGDIGQTLRYVHRPVPSGEPNAGYHVRSWRPYRVREWQHLAIVNDCGRMLVYLDGVVVADKQYPLKDLPDDLQLLIGQVYLNESTRVFFGQLDELAIYPRALSASEVVKRHDLVIEEASARSKPPEAAAPVATPSSTAGLRRSAYLAINRVS